MAWTDLATHVQSEGSRTLRRSGTLLRALMATLLVGAILGRASAQAQPARVPTPEEAMRAFNSAQAWVVAGEVGGARADNGPREGIGAGGASVTLRYAGRVVGRGTSFAQADGLARAVGTALVDAAARIPLPEDRATRDEILRSIALTLELAGPLTPIAPDALADAGLTLAPGIDGVAARLGERVEAIFPEAMLMAGMDARGALGAAAGMVTGEPGQTPRDPERVRRDLGVTFLTFRTAHLAQPRPGDAPVFLYRGSRVPSEAPVSVADLCALADAIAANLIARVWEEPSRLGVRGVYLPVSDRFDPETAAPADQALTALALWRYAGTVGIDAEIGRRGAGMARRLLDDLAVVEPGEVAPEASVAGAALTSGVIREVYAEGGPEMPKVVAALLALCDARVDERSDQAGVEASLVAWARAVRAVSSGRQEDRDAALRAVRAAFLATPAPMLAGQMPWLGWADAMLAPAEGPVPAGEALRQMRRLIWTHQLRPEDVGSEGADLVGGIVFTASRTPLPTWQSLRVLAFLAWMMGDGRLTDSSEVAPELSHVLAGMRFLRALTADAAACHMFQAPALATGGVRAAPWDQRMPPDAGAMGLVTVCEALGALGARSPGPVNRENPPE